ncbi:MAG: caspase family protein, partial [Candidatus Marinimicrobia bacterium]|nr:caspase family protein [Candidatus Neomarinimicrobiota bacterium]
VPPELTMRVAFVEPNSNGFLDAEEKGKVKVSITNSGQGSAMGVFVKLNAETSNRDITAETSKIIGEVPAGQTKTTEFEINASKSVTRMENRFTVSATESYGFPPDPAQISFETFPFIPPKLELVDFGVSTPNEGNEIRPQTTTEVQARVQNRGQGPAEDVQFSINLPKGVYFTPDSKQDYSFSSLKPGEFKDLEFSFNTAKTVGKTIDVSIGFTEESTTGKFPLDLDVAKPQQTIQQLVVKGQKMETVEFADVATVSVDIEKDIPKLGRKGKHDLAVVFGIESYKNVPGVSFAKRDAEWMKKYFENVLGIPKNRIYHKTDSDVGQAEFSKVFSEDGWLDKRVEEGKSNLYIYYAGHGAPDLKKNKAYLIPYDGDPNYASQTGYEMDALYEQLGNLGAASVTVFLDACFSGANRDNEMLLANARPVFMEVDASMSGNVTVFSAAGGKEISSAWPEKKHGLFSYYLMKGMRGDADANNDNQITVGELGDYVKENVSNMAGMLDREQTPGLQTMDPNKVLIHY